MKLKNSLRVLLVGAMAMSMVACSQPETKKASGNDQTKQEENNTTNEVKKGNVYSVEEATTEDSGITQTIKEVSVFDNMTDAVKSYNQNEVVVTPENEDKVTIVVAFEIKNSNKFKINTYPTQAKIITNAGEQKEADMMASESFDGEIFEGVTKEGHVLFTLDKTKIEDLTSFKFAWSTDHDNGTPENYDDDYYKDNKLEVNLK